MLKYLVPVFPLKDLPIMLAFAAGGSLIAGCYGIVHDQITFAIGPEYFTNFKFFQFKWANVGQGDLLFVSTIGFLATWWVGLITAWILCRRLLPGMERKDAIRNICKGIFLVFAMAILFGVGGYILGLARGPNADYSNWEFIFNKLKISDRWAFVRVGYIHNAGYLGGLTGLALTYVLIKPGSTNEDTAVSEESGITHERQSD